MAWEDILQNNGIEDVRWLCSLSEPELDLLISLKNLVHQRAKNVRREALAKKFDLKMFRALGFILMEHLKEELKDASIVPGLVTSSSSFLDRPSNDKVRSMNVEELKEYVVGSDRIKKLLLTDQSPNGPLLLLHQAQPSFDDKIIVSDQVKPNAI